MHIYAIRVHVNVKKIIITEMDGKSAMESKM